MTTQRVGLTALRRVAVQSPIFFTQNIPRAALASGVQSIQSRPITTEKLTQTDASSLLAQQRLKRPVSPHLAIYDFRQTWLGGSIWQRITGSVLSGSLYVFGAAYLVAPLTGWHLESASLVAAFATWPVLAKGGVKFLIAWPFTFHAFNGVRHLLWDFAIGFQKAKLSTISNYLWFASLLTTAGMVAFL